MSSLRSANSYVSCSLHEAVKLRATNESLVKYKPKTIPEFFLECCQKYKCLPALAFQTNSGESENLQKLGESAGNTSPWITVNYTEYEKHVEQAALALLHLGVPARTSVSIMAFNCPEWFYIQMGALRINAVSAGIYITSSAESVYHVLDTSDASVVVVDGIAQLEKVREIKSRLPKLRAVIQLHGPFDFTEAEQKNGYYRWCDLVDMKFDDAKRAELDVRESQVAANDCALLMFTSGTVGMPKGCMISHDGILNTSRTVTSTFTDLVPGSESLVTYLPLNNLASQTFDIFMAMEIGAVVHFADRNALKGSLFKTYMKAKPTFILGVPRIFEKMHEILTEVDASSTSLVKYIMGLARNTVLEYHLNRMDGKPAGSLQNWIASIITHRIKTILGLERCKTLLIGTAPVSEAIKRYFLSVDLPLTEAYGMTETSGPIVFNLNSPNSKSSGKVVHGIELTIREPNENGEGEIIVRGRSNMMGYLKEPEKTKAALTDDGWVLSGDTGFIDEEGNIYVNGRIKELIITSGGMKIPPIHIEQILKKEMPCISNALVIGDRRKYLTVLLTFKTHIDQATGYPLQTLQPETTEWLDSLGLHYKNLSEMLQIKLPENLKDFDPCSIEAKPHKILMEAIEAGIQKVNALAMTNAHKIQYFRILPHDFSVPTGEFGPTLKVRRTFILSKYEKIIQKMYDQC